MARRGTTRVLLAVAAQLFAIQDVLAAQETSLRPGTVIRIHRGSVGSDTTRIGVLTTLTHDSLLFRDREWGVVMGVSRSSIRAIERQQRARRYILEGTVLGFVGGAAIGAVLGAASVRCKPGFDCSGQKMGVGIGAIGGAVYGTVAGTAIGWWKSRPKWVAVQLRM